MTNIRPQMSLTLLTIDSMINTRDRHAWEKLGSSDALTQEQSSYILNRIKREFDAPVNSDNVNTFFELAAKNDRISPKDIIDVTLYEKIPKIRAHLITRELGRVPASSDELKYHWDNYEKITGQNLKAITFANNYEKLWGFARNPNTPSSILEELIPLLKETSAVVALAENPNVDRIQANKILNSFVFDFQTGMNIIKKLALNGLLKRKVITVEDLYLIHEKKLKSGKTYEAHGIEEYILSYDSLSLREDFYNQLFECLNKHIDSSLDFKGIPKSMLAAILGWETEQKFR